LRDLFQTKQWRIGNRPGTFTYVVTANIQPAKASDLVWTFGAGATVVLAAVVPLYLLPSSFGTSEAVTYVGVLLTAAVAVIGYINNRQSARRLSDEHERDEHHLRKERDEERQRLKLDAAMRAGALFVPVDDKPIHPASAASGLLALTRLDQVDLAVVLLVDLWSGDKASVSTETAVLVIDAALRSHEDPEAQLIAAELLCRNAKRLDPCQSLHWPSAVDGCWDATFGPRTKLLIVDALIRMALAGPHQESALRSVAVRLYGIWAGDEDPRVKGCVGTLIRALTPRLATLGYTDFLQGNSKVMLSQLEAAAASGTANPDGFLDRMVIERSKQLQAWATNCQHIDDSTRGLADAAHAG
jgi:hypothetical protein